LSETTSAPALPPRIRLDDALPRSLAVGRGSVLLLRGTCTGRPRRIDLTFAGKTYRTTLRRDETKADETWFWTYVPISAINEAASHEVTARITDVDGPSTVDVGAVRLMPVLEDEFEPPSLPATDEAGPLVVICMTTYNPPRELLQLQVDSIRGQTYRNWHCIVRDDASDEGAFAALQEVVGDDARFSVCRNSERLGFYNNFEACLNLVPPQAQFVTLADQDDRWHEDKLQALLDEFRPETTLAYSDMNIVDTESNLQATTFWESKPNGYDDLVSLILLNTVTGAASMFRRELLDLALPFPQKVGQPYHDHWLGCVALAAGEVRYIDRPLYDYVQHASNVIGHNTFPAGALKRYWTRLMKFVTSWLLSGSFRRERFALWQTVYLREVQRTHVIAQTLAQRLPRLRGHKRHAVRRLGAIDTSLVSFVWLPLRGLGVLRKPTPTLGTEYNFLRGLLWLNLRRWRRAK
jgi:glycosyltransferase involved in cell wall biosynthesis